MHPHWSLSANIYEVNIRQYTHDGTFKAFEQNLPRLKNMGVKILWFMPIYPISEKDRLGSLGSYYAIQDYKAINPEFGDMEEFKALMKKAHELEFKVIIDIVANHTGNDHHWVKENPGYFVYTANGELVHPEGWEDVAKLNYDNPDLRKAMIDVLKFWITEGNVDGFRCDMAHLVPLDFWVEAKEYVSEIKSDLFWLAECEVPEYHKVFDATYTWSWMHASEQYYHGKMSLEDLMVVLYKSIVEFPCDAYRAYFTSNHDENSWNGTEYEKYGDAAQMFAVFSCTWEGIPMIYSGQEAANHKRIKFFDKDEIDWSRGFVLENFYKTLLDLKKNNPALSCDGSKTLTKIVSHPKDSQIFSFLRTNDQQKVLVVLNFSSEDRHFEIVDVEGTYKNVFGGPDINFAQNRTVFISRWGYLVFEYKH